MKISTDGLFAPSFVGSTVEAARSARVASFSLYLHMKQMTPMGSMGFSLFNSEKKNSLLLTMHEGGGGGGGVDGTCGSGETRD